MRDPRLCDAVEALLFVADRPLTIAELSSSLQRPETEVVDAVAELEQRLMFCGGLQLVRLAGGVQLATRPEFSELVHRFLTPSPKRIGRSLLEVLAIVAYRQPVTLAEIDALRGVQSDYGVSQLLERGLIREAGRKSSPGRPILYATTREFLHQFRLDRLDDLPPVAESKGIRAASPSQPR